MKRKFFVLLMILTFLAITTVPALARGGLEKGRPPSPTPTPIPTEIPDTGELYGDLYVVLRDEWGAPILDGNGCIQPIADDDPAVFTEVDDQGNLFDSTTIETIDGTVTITAYASEPFSLPYYTDPDGDLVACELTEDMANWVQNVDFGRLNLGRAPDMVINHAFDEATNKMNLACEIELDPSGRIMLEIDANCDDDIKEWTTIDSPAENLALYIQMMTVGHWIIPEETLTSRKGGDPAADPVYRPVLSPEARALIATFNSGHYSNLVDDTSTIDDLDVYDLQLAAALLAGAADKFGEITLDMVVYINSIYGINQAAGTENGFFNFAQYQYGLLGGRTQLYLVRSSLECGTRNGLIYVLQPVTISDKLYYEPKCVFINSVVHFNDFEEIYITEGVADYEFYESNVRGFAQAANDSLQVLEYVHNYSVPEDIYAGE